MLLVVEEEIQDEGVQEGEEGAETNEEESVAGDDNMSGAMTTALPAPSVQSLAPLHFRKGLPLPPLPPLPPNLCRERFEFGFGGIWAGVC